MKPVVTARDLVYRGAYRLTTPLGNTAGLTYCASRGTWFTIAVRQKLFRLFECSMPDDETWQPGPVAPSVPLESAPRAVLVHDHGTVLADVIDAQQNDVHSILWDEATDRLYVSFGDFYGDPVSQDCLVAIDVGTNPPSVAGPWPYGDLGSVFSQRWGYSQCVPAPHGLAVDGIQYLATGKDNNTFQSGSWGPGLVGIEDDLDPWRPPHEPIEARQIMFWPSRQTPVVLDTGKVKPGFLSSDMLREHPSWIIAGESSAHLGGAPEWSDVPYGVAELHGGWTTGDDAGYLVAVDEPGRTGVEGLLYFGLTSFGAHWYGSPVEFANDYTADPYSPTGWRSWSGIDADGTDRYLTSPVFPPDERNPKAYVFGRQGGGKGNRAELRVPALWIYAMCDIHQAIGGAYEPRAGLTSLNVDWHAFHILASPLPLPDVRLITPSLQYESRVNRSPRTEVAYIPQVTGAHYRQGDGERPGRIYVRMSSSLGVETDAVNVWDIIPGGE